MINKVPAMASMVPTTSVLSMVGFQSEYTRLYCAPSANLPSGKVSNVVERSLSKNK